MPGRAPSFVVVGLAMIIFLIGFFYMSCSSKTTELRQTLDGFEERIRSLTIKNSDNEKEIELIKNQKREVEQDKSNIQKQMEKKDSELSELNTRLNQKSAELQGLKSDKQVLDDQLKQFKNNSDRLASRNSAIDKLQQEYDEQKKSGAQELLRLKEEIENYKKQLNNAAEKPVEISNQRFPPLLPSNETTKNNSSFFQEPLDKLNQLKNEVKDKIAPVISDIKRKASHVFDAVNNSNINQNLPAPPLSNNTQEEQQLFRNRRDRERGGEGDSDNQRQNNVEALERRKRLLNGRNKDQEYGDRPRHNIEHGERTANGSRRVLFNENNIANNQSDNAPSQVALDRNNYRVRNRGESHRALNKNNQDQVIVNGNKEEQKFHRGNIL